MAWTDNLIGYWKLEETAGPTADDAHSTNDGTYYTSGITYDQTGKINKCVTFDGANGKITLPDNADTQFETSDFSIVAWAFPTAFGALWKTIIGGESGAFTMGTYNTGGAFFCDKIDLWAGPNTGQTLTIDTWNFICVVFDSTATTNNITININGTPATGTFNVDFTAGAASNLIGVQIGTTAYFTGLLDEIGIWKRKLTTDEVTALYNSGNGLTYPFESWTSFNAKAQHFSTF